jgi:hypothetical protein
MAKKGRLNVVKTKIDDLLAKKGFIFSFDFNVSIKATRD